MKQSLPPLRIEVDADEIRVITFTGGFSRVRSVSAQQLAQIVTGVPTGTGLLPENTLFQRTTNDGANQIGIFIDAHIRELNTGDHKIPVALPPLVWVGTGLEYNIHAVAQRPTSLDEPLYYPPLPNVYASTKACFGTDTPKLATAETIRPTFEQWSSNIFTIDMSSNRCQSQREDVRNLWRTLDPQQPFPIQELIRTRFTIGEYIHD